MAYVFVPILADLQKLEALLKQVKSEGRYAGNEQAWDSRVIGVVQAHCKTAEKHVLDNSVLMQGVRDYAKLRIDTVEGFLKKKTLEDKEVQVIELTAQSVAKKVADAIADDGELTKACVEYRGGWPATARGLLSNPKLLEPFLATRENGINLGKQVVTLKHRSEEYAVRLQEMSKLAKQRQKQGAVDVAEFTKDIDEIESKLKTMKDEVVDLHFKQQRAVAAFAKWKKQKAWTPEEIKEARQRHPGLVAAAKEARGRLKTMTVLFEGLEERGKAAGPGWKDRALAAVKTAKPHLAGAESECKTFDSEEKTSTEVYKKMTG
jgi:predicted transcriptional regulator